MAGGGFGKSNTLQLMPEGSKGSIEERIKLTGISKIFKKLIQPCEAQICGAINLWIENFR